MVFLRCPALLWYEGLVSRRFEPSQPQRITSGLMTLQVIPPKLLEQPLNPTRHEPRKTSPQPTFGAVGYSDVPTTSGQTQIRVTASRTSTQMCLMHVTIRRLFVLLVGID